MVSKVLLKVIGDILMNVFLKNAE